MHFFVNEISPYNIIIYFSFCALKIFFLILLIIEEKLITKNARKYITYTDGMILKIQLCCKYTFKGLKFIHIKKIL